MSVPSSIPNAHLAQRCVEETDKFHRRQISDPQFCFELFRRALREQSNEAFTFIYQIYERYVMSAIQQNPRFSVTGESAEYFANSAFRSFYVALRGPRFDKMSTLPQTLSYLRACTQTAIAMYLRGKQAPAHPSIDDVPEPAADFEPGERIEAQALWTRIQHALPDERDQLLARLAFILEYRPREICGLYPVYWPNERSVSLALFRIRRVLRAALGDPDDPA